MTLQLITASKCYLTLEAFPMAQCINKNCWNRKHCYLKQLSNKVSVECCHSTEITIIITPLVRLVTVSKHNKIAKCMVHLNFNGFQFPKISTGYVLKSFALCGATSYHLHICLCIWHNNCIESASSWTQ